MRVTLFEGVPLICVALLLVPTAKAGPSFNSDAKELAEHSRTAGAALHMALADMHLMLRSLELDMPDQAELKREEALKNLDSAIENYNWIAEKAPRQPLVIEPHTYLERLAVQSLPQALERRGIEFPRTEKDLAILAAMVVKHFRSTIANSPRFDKTSAKAYTYFHSIFREEGFLLNVGIYASVIWEMQPTSEPGKASPSAE
jgi:hypothetical protein